MGRAYRAIAADIRAERLTRSDLPFGARLAAAAVLATLATAIAIAPHAVPGLVVPGPAAMHAMKAMG